MEEYLKSKGFAKIPSTNEWCKGSWTVRIIDRELEAFQDLKKKNNNRYILLNYSEENLKDLVEAIIYNI